jgi:hypothetical protein
MKSEQPGLRKRLRLETRRLFSQHRQLDSFYARIIDAVQRGSVQQARPPFRQFHDALAAHFAVEEKTHFPALHGLVPESEGDLAQLLHEHARFRRELGRLDELLDLSDLKAFGKRLHALAADLASHEDREEELFERSIGAPSLTD